VASLPRILGLARHQQRHRNRPAAGVSFCHFIASINQLESLQRDVVFSLSLKSACNTCFAIPPARLHAEMFAATSDTDFQRSLNLAQIFVERTATILPAVDCPQARS